MARVAPPYPPAHQIVPKLCAVLNILAEVAVLHSALDGDSAGEEERELEAAQLEERELEAAQLEARELEAAQLEARKLEAAQKEAAQLEPYLSDLDTLLVGHARKRTAACAAVASGTARTVRHAQSQVQPRYVNRSISSAGTRA